MNQLFQIALLFNNKLDKRIMHYSLVHQVYSIIIILLLQYLDNIDSKHLSNKNALTRADLQLCGYTYYLDGYCQTIKSFQTSYFY